VVIVGHGVVGWCGNNGYVCGDGRIVGVIQVYCVLLAWQGWSVIVGLVLLVEHQVGGEGCCVHSGMRSLYYSLCCCCEIYKLIY
jgi:hypothetical protein